MLQSVGILCIKVGDSTLYPWLTHCRLLLARTRYSCAILRFRTAWLWNEILLTVAYHLLVSKLSSRSLSGIIIAVVAVSTGVMVSIVGGGSLCLTEPCGCRLKTFFSRRLQDHPGDELRLIGFG